MGDPSTGPLFHQQCVVAANLQTLPVNHIHFASFTYFLNVAYFHIFLIFVYDSIASVGENVRKRILKNLAIGPHLH